MEGGEMIERQLREVLLRLAPSLVFEPVPVAVDKLESRLQDFASSFGNEYLAGYYAYREETGDLLFLADFVGPWPNNDHHTAYFIELSYDKDKGCKVEILPAFDTLPLSVKEAQ